MIRFLADASLRDAIVSGCLRREPAIDFLSANDAKLEGVPDPEVLSSAKSGLTFAPDALRALNLHRWPGNVRELQNRVQRAVIMADGKRVTAKDLELTDAVSSSPPQTLKEARESVERAMVQEALRRHRGKITSAAVELGISRPTLYELMEKLGIAKDS